MRIMTKSLGLFCSVFIHVAWVDAVIVKLPYPDDGEVSFANDKDQAIVLRSSKDDKTPSSECPCSKLTFDELFDESCSDTIIIAGLITEINNKSVAHHFDALALMSHFFELLPEKPTIATISYDQYYELRYGYRNVIDLEDLDIYTFIDGRMSETEEEWYAPLFVSPIDRQQIKTIHFFEISRESKDDTFSYSVQHVNDLDGMFLNDEAIDDFADKLFKNMFWRDKIIQSVSKIKDILSLTVKDYISAEKEYIKIDPIIALKKDDIAQDKELPSLLKDGMCTWYEEFALYFYGKKNYSKSLFYSEKNLDNSDALVRAAKIRLGLMKRAPLQEQLKGLDLCEELLARFKKNDEDKIHYALVFENLLYGKTKNELQNVPSYKKLAISQISDFFQESKVHYEKYLEKYPDLSDHKRSDQEENIKRINALVLSLQQAQEQQKTLLILENKKPHSVDKEDSSPKRLKQK